MGVLPSPGHPWRLPHYSPHLRAQDGEPLLATILRAVLEELDSSVPVFPGECGQKLAQWLRLITFFAPVKYFTMLDSTSCVWHFPYSSPTVSCSTEQRK